jgi:hypothetical protein
MHEIFQIEFKGGGRLGVSCGFCQKVKITRQVTNKETSRSISSPEATDKPRK